MLALARGGIVSGAGLRVHERVVPGDEHLEALELAPSLGGLGTSVADEDLLPDAYLPKPLQQGRVEESQRDRERLQEQDREVSIMQTGLKHYKHWRGPA